MFDGKIRVVAIDIGTEGDKGIGDLRADSAESHDADLPAHELMAYEGLLVALCILHDVGVVRVVLDPVDGALGVTGVHEDHADNELLHGVRVAAGGVEDDDAALSALLERDVVDAGAGAGDAADRRPEVEAVDVGGTDQDSICLVDVVGLLVAFAELGHAVSGDVLCDVVEHLYIAHGSALLSNL